jgi:hypothetical protein
MPAPGAVGSAQNLTRLQGVLLEDLTWEDG